MASLAEVLSPFGQGLSAKFTGMEDVILQMSVPERDQSALRFFWYENRDFAMILGEFWLNVLSYDTFHSLTCYHVVWT